MALQFEHLPNVSNPPFLQKRLMNLASSSTGIIKNIKKEPEDKNKKSSTSGGNNTTGSKDSGTKLSAAGEYKLKKIR